MIKKLLNRGLLGFVFILASLSAQAGLLFNVIESGTPVSVDIALCLNGVGPVSCQRLHVSSNRLQITPVTAHLYATAGIKILTPGFEPSGCTLFPPSGYCLFAMGPTTAAAIELNGSVTIYTVTPSGDGHVSITPSTPQRVTQGQRQQFTVAAQSGYTLSAAVGGNCPQGTWAGAVYTTGIITADCSVAFSATQNPVVTYTIGGTVSNLTGSGLILQNNGGDNLAVTAGSTNFQFANPVAANSPYSVTVLQQPVGQTCTISNGSGTATGNVTNIAVNCFDPTVISVTGSPLLLTPDTTGTLTVTNNGTVAAVNVAATLPPGLAANVTQDATGCASLAAGSTCFLRFTVNSMVSLPTTVSIAGDNTNTQTATITLGFPYVANGGGVNAMVYDAENEIIYLGGSFTELALNTGSGAPFSTTSAQPLAVFPRVDGTIFTVVEDGNGGWFIGGDFSNVNGIARTRLAHILSDGTLDSAWTPTANQAVSTMVLNGSTLYVGGQFASISGQGRLRIAALDAGTGTVTGWNPNTTGNTVNALVLNGTTLYVGGDFTSIGGQARNRIAALDTATGLATAWNPNADNIVNSLALGGSTLYVGGNFSTIGGQTRTRIAALDTSSGAATSWNPSANAIVRALVADGSTIFAAGDFTTIGGQSRNRIAALDATTGSALAWNPNPNGVVLTLIIDGTTLYAGGSYTTIGGQSRNRIAALDTSTGLASAWNPDVNSTVRALALSGDGSSLYVAGNFNSAAPLARPFLAAIDAQTGIPTAWNPNANNAVFSLSLVPAPTSLLYVGGTFTNIGGQARNRIAAISTATGLATAWNPNATSGTVVALLAAGNTIYAGGTFTNIGGQARNRIAAIDENSGNATAWNPNANNLVSTFVLSGATLYVGGSFTSIGGQARNNVAALSTSTGTAISWNPNANASVNTIAISGTTVYIGGTFTSVGGQSRSRIAALDANTGAVTAWDPNAFGSVNILVPRQDVVYVGGTFTTIGGQTRNRIAAISIASGAPSNWAPSLNSSVQALALSDSTVYAGGIFTTVNNTPFANFAVIPMNLPQLP